MSYYCEFKLFETLIWAETERERGGRGPRPPPGKLQVAMYFLDLKEKLEEAIPPPPPFKLSGSAHACLTEEFLNFHFLHAAYFLKLTDYVDVQADLRLCSTKSSFSQQGTYGMG